jgi:hypothetical protein
MYTKYNLTKVRCINKSNNHLSPQIIEHTQINTTYSDENLVMGQTQDCGGVKPVNGTQPSPFHNYIYKKQVNYHDSDIRCYLGDYFEQVNTLS